MTCCACWVFCAVSYCSCVLLFSFRAFHLWFVDNIGMSLKNNIIDVMCQIKLKDKAEKEIKNAASKADEIEAEEAKKLVEKLTGTASNDEESTREIVKNAARAVGSISDVEFDLTFNPDVFQDHVRHANTEVSFSYVY